MLFRLAVEGSLFNRSLNAFVARRIFNGWPAARESPKAMEPPPPVPVSSTKPHYRRIKGERQQVSLLGSRSASRNYINQALVD